MQKQIQFSVNGESRTVTTHPDRPLLDVLREDLHLTGAKYGCGEGQCGACTVLVDGKSMHSCITPVSDVSQKQILTIEGLARDGQLHPVQEAFLAAGAMQCGYCTPGMILTVAGALTELPQPTVAAVRARLESHLCRCCGYPRILDAIKQAVTAHRR